MYDFASLQPTDATPAALTAAIARCSLAGRGSLAEIEWWLARRERLAAEFAEVAALRREMQGLARQMAS